MWNELKTQVKASTEALNRELKEQDAIRYVVSDPNKIDLFIRNGTYHVFFRFDIERLNVGIGQINTDAYLQLKS